MLPIDMYNISLERSFHSDSDRVSCIKIHAEMKALLQVKVLTFYIHWCLWFLTAYSHSLIKYLYYFTHKSYKMVDNKSKTPLIRHIYICICHSGSFPILHLSLVKCIIQKYT